MLPGRHNVYDSVEEFWVVTKETGVRQESHTYEEIHQQRQKAMLISKHHMFTTTLNQSNINLCLQQCLVSSRSCKAMEEPNFQLGDKFKMLEGTDARMAGERAKADKLGPNMENKYAQVGLQKNVAI